MYGLPNAAVLRAKRFVVASVPLAKESGRVAALWKMSAFVGRSFPISDRPMHTNVAPLAIAPRAVMN